MMLSDKNWVLKAIIEVSPDTIFQYIVAMKQKEMSALGSDYNDALTIDEVHHTVTLTGHWWYQGVHTVHTHPKGSQVTYKVSNIARVARTLAFLTTGNRTACIHSTANLQSRAADNLSP